MAAFATPEELRRRLRVASIDVDAAGELLERASDVIRAEVGLELETVTGDIVVAEVTGNVALLPVLPVNDVPSVLVDGVELEPGVDYTWSRAGVLTRIGAPWPTTPRSVIATVDHGATPPILGVIAIELAWRVWTNPDNLSSETVPDHTVGFGPGSGRLELTDYERRLLDSLRP